MVVVGEKYGRLTVKSIVKIDNMPYCICDCDCGKKDVKVYRSSIESGRTKSCGCYNLEKLSERRHDMVGEKRGEWTVLEYLGNGKYKCQCSCGTISNIEAGSLRSGNSTSCGCVGKKERNKKVDSIIGETFGDFVVESVVDYNSRRLFYNVVCKNGHKRKVRSDRLKKLTVCSECNAKPKETKEKRVPKVVKVGDRFGRITVIGLFTENNRTMCKCRCDCGNIFDVYKGGIYSRKSCGKCIRTDITGEKFGHWTALEYNDDLGKWKCQCDCENKTIRYVSLSDLNSGHSTSCGHTKQSSKAEDDICDFIHSIDKNININRRNRTILAGKEIDIYLPDYKLGIEYNGSIFHASVNGAFDGKSRLYHQQKFLSAKENDVHLINLFDVDWDNNQEKIRDYIVSILTVGTKVFARKCTVSKIDKGLACDFVDKYHLQGANNRTMNINYGLFFNKELLAVMSFGQPRMKEDVDGYFELHRFCIKSGYKIIGGASKLFTAFCRDYEPRYILSYSDNDFFTGGVYVALGFNYDGQALPRYFWYSRGEEIKREKCMVKKLKVKYPELYQEALDNNVKNKEDYIMSKLGASKVFRSGNTRWVWSCLDNTQ